MSNPKAKSAYRQPSKLGIHLWLLATFLLSLPARSGAEELGLPNALGLSSALKSAQQADIIASPEWKIYSLNAVINHQPEQGNYYSFTFFDDDQSLHTVILAKGSEPRVSSRPANHNPILASLDTNSLPLPQDLCDEPNLLSMITASFEAIEKLNMGEPDTAQIQIQYSILLGLLIPEQISPVWHITIAIKDQPYSKKVTLADNRIISIAHLPR